MDRPLPSFETEPGLSSPEARELKEACGVFGIYAPGRDVSQLTYLGLHALQHRGQEAAGMAVSDGNCITVDKDKGLVAAVFNETKLAALTGYLAVGQVRYSTTGPSTWHNAQPAYRSDKESGLEFALGHNGNLINTSSLRSEITAPHELLNHESSDSDVVAELIIQEMSSSGDGHKDLETALPIVLPKLEGAFAFVLMDETSVFGVRDPNGFRPLCLGKVDGGWVLASETPALDIVGAKFVREIEPGEMVKIDDQGIKSFYPFAEETIDPRLCLFEFVYFARPDARLYGRGVHAARLRMGELLAEQAPVAADMVMGVPESGTPAAEGYARASHIPYGQGLVKNRYIGRTFIAPTQEMREASVRLKLNPLRDNIEGKRLVVVDDSIVRGTTQKTLVRMLREAGATEVHLRITSPPVKWPCFYGIDTGDRNELLAAQLEVDEIRDYVGADSLSYLSLDRLRASTGAHEAGFCDACFTGDYPTPVPLTIGRHATAANLAQ